MELLKLRQNWRLRRIGSTIVGDLTYKSVGSRSTQPGRFEVSKDTEASDPSVPGLKVTVPSDLNCVSYMQVTIHGRKSLELARSQ